MDTPAAHTVSHFQAYKIPCLQRIFSDIHHALHLGFGTQSMFECISGKDAPSSQGFGQVLQSADEIGMDAAFSSAMTSSVTVLVPMIKDLNFLAVANMSAAVRRARALA